MEIASTVVNGVKYAAVIKEEAPRGFIHKIEISSNKSAYNPEQTRFYLKDRREDFLLALFDLYAKHPVSSHESLLPKQWSITDAVEFSKYVEGIDVSDAAQVHSIALYSTGWSKRLSTNTKLVREHLKMYEKEFKSHRDRDVLFWDVSRAQWGLDTWEKIHSVPIRFFTPPIIKRCADPEYVDFAVIATKIPSWRHSETKVRDFTGKQEFEMKWTNLPVHHKVFRDYVLDLTVSEYGQILKKIPVSTSAEGAVAMADEILGRAQTVNTVEGAVDAYVAVATAIEQVTNWDYWTELNRFYLRRHSKSANLLAVAKGYTETFAPRTMPAKAVHLMNEILFNNNRGRWCASAKQCDYIAGRLIELTGSPCKAWDVILGAYSSERVLTFSKWEKFLNEWETLKDMPSDLAVYLV